MLSDFDDLSPQPIISSIGTYNDSLAKLLTEFFDPVISKEHCAKYAFTFIKKHNR